MSKIKLSFGIKYEKNFSSGKHKFANRLVDEMKKSYSDLIEIVPRNFTSDVHLTFDGIIKPDCKNVYRIDGIWINTLDDYKSKNKPLISGLTHADHIIYQSDFCKQTVETIFKIKRPNHIIMNGADPKEFALDPAFKPDKPTFISTCKWRPHKRLKYIVDGFIRSKCSEESYLYIYGDVDPSQQLRQKNIRYMGWSDEINKVVPWCVSSVYLSFLDWCPNAVVESLVAGVPVIYANSGGVPYIVKDSGISIPDLQWDFKPLRLYDDYPVSCKRVANAYDRCFEMKDKTERVHRPDLFIDNIAKQYVDCICSVHSPKKGIAG